MEGTLNRRIGFCIVVLAWREFYRTRGAFAPSPQATKVIKWQAACGGAVLATRSGGEYVVIWRGGSGWIQAGKLRRK